MKNRLADYLADLAGAVATATNAPDQYPDYLVEICGGMAETYQMNRDRVFEAWAGARPGLKRDLDKASFIESRLESAFSAFDRGDRGLGQELIFEVYNLQLRKLR